MLKILLSIRDLLYQLIVFNPFSYIWSFEEVNETLPAIFNVLLLIPNINYSFIVWKNV